MRAKIGALTKTTLVLCLVGRLGAADKPNRTADGQALRVLEEQWLRASDAGTLDRILAPDFVHVVPLDRFLTKQEHIEWFVNHPAPAGRNLRFDKLQIRFYGDVGIVNGTVVATDPGGKELDRTAFTDVFVYRDGRWQAVNAQENQVRQRSK
jgi:hypothetical protein